ncbi:MAG: 30S ribosomal protein S11 [Patescibacteria group bacterium]
MGVIRVKTKTETEVSDAKKVAAARGKKIKYRLSRGKAYIQSSYNNTIVTVCDLKGNVITWGSAGVLGFHGPKRATPYAATEIVKYILEKLKNTGLKELYLFVKGIGAGKEAAIRAFATGGMTILSIRDITPIPHNGPRPPKVRRV